MKKSTISNRPYSIMDGFFRNLTSIQKQLFKNNFLHPITNKIPPNQII